MNNTIISQEEVVALLGRPLSTLETANFSLYMQIAVLRLDDLLCIKLEDMADIPVDLKLLIARCFATIVMEQKASANHGISSKKVEDFSINYDGDTDSPMVAFVSQNAATIDKYGKCQGSLRSGKACCGYCF